MTNTILGYIRRQPSVLAQMLAASVRDTAEFVDIVVNKRPDRIYIFASGTSLNAAQAAAPLMTRALGIEVTPAAPSWPLTPRGERPLGLFVSHEGTSTNTLDALERWGANTSLAVVATEGSILQRRASARMMITCGPEHAGPKTLGYTATVLALQLAALAAGQALGAMLDRDADDLRTHIGQALANMPGNIDRAEAWYAANAERLRSLSAWALVGRRTAGRIAQEGALKILETVRRPATGYDFEEFLHGPMMVARPGVGAFFLIPADPADAARMLRLADWFDGRGGMAMRFGAVEARGAADVQLAMTGYAETTPYEQVLAPQVLAALLPPDLGLDDGKSTFEEVSALVATKWTGADT